MTVGVSQSMTVLGMSVGTTVWLAALTLILFILMVVSFNRWRQQKRQQRQTEEDDVTSATQRLTSNRPSAVVTQAYNFIFQY